MTELQSEQIVGRMFPNWGEHLHDGKVLDHILEGLASDHIIFNRCSRPSCNNVARTGLKTCTRCAAKTAQYRRLYKRRKKPATNAHNGRTKAFRRAFNACDSTIARFLEHELFLFGH
jgi:hypothetical protein